MPQYSERTNELIIIENNYFDLILEYLKSKRKRKRRWRVMDGQDKKGGTKLISLDLDEFQQGTDWQLLSIQCSQWKQ